MKSSVRSYDIFDTLITRKTATPYGVFLIMQDRLVKQHNEMFIPLYLCNNFAKYREMAEKRAIENIDLLYREEISLCDIYHELARLCIISENQIVYLMELEQEIEIENVVPIENNISELLSVANENQVILISDMYLPKETIVRMLDSVNPMLNQFPIYISNEVGRRKSTGALYEYVIDKHNIDVNHWIHCGDNELSDICKVENLGGKAIKREYAKLSEFEREIMSQDVYKNDLHWQQMIGCIKNGRLSKLNDDCFLMGNNYAGIIIFQYVYWIIQCALEQGITELYFIARDGYIPKQIADIIIEVQGINISTKYIYGSRVAWHRALMGRSFEDAERAIEFIAFNSIDELCFLLNISQENMREYLADIDLDFKGKLSIYEKIEVRRIIKDNTQLHQEVYSNAEELYKSTICYLQENINIDSNYAFVEMNGTGFTQDILQELVNSFSSYNFVTFYYDILPKKNVFKTDTRFFVFSPYYRVCNVSNLLELFTRAPHGLTLGYEYKNNEWSPVLTNSIDGFQNNDDFNKYLDSILTLSKNILRMSKSAILLDYNIGWQIRKMCENTDICVIQNCIGDFVFAEDAWSLDTRIYAPVISDEDITEIVYGTDTQELIKSYKGINLELSLKRSNMLLAPAAIDAVKNCISMWDFSVFRSKDKVYQFIVYGAGKRGKRIYYGLANTEGVNVALWVDRSIRKVDSINVYSPENISDYYYDFIYVAVANENSRAAIIKYLMKLGVEEHKIITELPS